MGRKRGDKNGVIGNGISKDQFEKLCSLFCTREEIAGFFRVSVNTLATWIKETYQVDTFKEAYTMCSTNGKIALRRKQMNLASKDSRMAIFLGKNYLGQEESPSEENDDAKNELETIVGKITLVTKKEVEESRQEEVSASND